MDLEDLDRELRGLDGAGYGAYKRLRDGRWRLDQAGLPDAELVVERVQADPYAPPSRCAISVPGVLAAVPVGERGSEPRRRAVADHLLRLFAAAVPEGVRADAGGQEVLDRTACRLGEDGSVTVRMGVALPAAGRRIKGRAAARLLAERLPEAAARTLVWEAIDPAAVTRAADTVEDAVALREQLAAAGLVAFAADGSVLPRGSGVDDRPLTSDGVVALRAPDELAVHLETPHSGTLRGLGVPDGVTLVVGGGFHGKSTLLRALERGVFDHVPGDGRERVVSRSDAVKIRAEDGRAVTRVDVSAFIGDLPTGDDTSDFTTSNASGSTSQAAAIVEACEVGAGVLLLDEDTSATNLMIRDAAMRELVTGDREPLTPYVDLVGSLYHDRGVSSVLVAGGSGDAFGAAHTVLHMDAFAPHDVTARAHAIARDRGLGRSPRTFPAVRARIPEPDTVDPTVGDRTKAAAKGTAALRFGRAHIDLGAVEQLVDPSQTEAVGRALVAAVRRGWLDGDAKVADVLDAVESALDVDGVGVLSDGYPGDLARPRRFEIAAALNRLRGLGVRGLVASADEPGRA